jgi:stage II sporulation protein D
VSDARDGGSGGFYCDISPRFRWREEWDAGALRATLARTLAPGDADGAPAGGDGGAPGGGGLPAIRDVAVHGKTRSGRVAELRIRFANGEVRIDGSDVRRVLRPAPDRYLGSTAFRLEVGRRGDEVTRLVATGVGWGHGVGLCQWGAVGRARGGQGYRKILATYFPGTTIERLY